jgi:hypothetical protein
MSLSTLQPQVLHAFTQYPRVSPGTALKSSNVVLDTVAWSSAAL